MINVATIIGLVLFAISETFGIIPVGPSGVLDSIFKGYQKVFGNLANDISMVENAQKTTT